MAQFISQLWDRFFRLLLKRTVWVLTLLFCIGVGIALANVSRLSSDLLRSQAIQNAALYTQSLKQAIDLYSESAADRAKTVEGVQVTHAYLNQEGSIPLPSTFAIELGDRISQQNGEVSVRFYSDYPFPWRKQNGGPRDKFEQDALIQLRSFPQRPFYRAETVGGHTVMRYGEASLMRATCVACHNTDPNSPKKDWAVGDVGGVWEVSQSLDGLMEKVDNNLRGTLLMFGGLSVIGILGISLVVSRLRQTAKDLEIQVDERTADLAQANVDLSKRNQLIRQVFGRYLSDEVVGNLLDSPEGLKLGGDRRKITILTSDLRGFSALSERLSPEEVIHILNLYLEQMADVINKHQGTIDEFMGDGILVLFGAPTSRPDDALRAIVCACEMQLVMGAVNERLAQMGVAPLQMGIGIHTGEVVVGNIGSEKRTKYGVVGSQVNLAYRIESYTKGGQVFASAEALKAAGAGVKISRKQQVHPKGYKRPIAIYEVYGVSGIYNIYLPKEEELFVPIPQPISVKYSLVKGKDISPNAFQGKVVKLSAQGAEIQYANDCGDDPLPPDLSNVKLAFLTKQFSSSAEQDVYAKVIERSPDQQSFCVHFTTVPPVVQAQLDKLYRSIAPKSEHSVG